MRVIELTFFEVEECPDQNPDDDILQQYPRINTSTEQNSYYGNMILPQNQFMVSPDQAQFFEAVPSAGQSIYVVPDQQNSVGMIATNDQSAMTFSYETMEDPNRRSLASLTSDQLWGLNINDDDDDGGPQSGPSHRDGDEASYHPHGHIEFNKEKQAEIITMDDTRQVNDKKEPTRNVSNSPIQNKETTLNKPEAHKKELQARTSPALTKKQNDLLSETKPKKMEAPKMLLDPKTIGLNFPRAGKKLPIKPAVISPAQQNSDDESEEASSDSSASDSEESG